MPLLHQLLTCPEYPSLQAYISWHVLHLVDGSQGFSTAAGMVIVGCAFHEGHRHFNTHSQSLQAGTFEERDCTAYAKEQLKGLMDDFQHESAAGCLQINELTSVEGEATVWLVRGSKRWASETDLVIEAHAGSIHAVGCDA